MTCDTEEYDDPIKIDIRLETYENSPVRRFFAQKLTSHLDCDEYYHHVERFFEKGLNALLDDPNFLLLYVPENGAKMRIVRPAEDPYHRKRMIKRINEAKPIPSFYYALSHLWGITENNRHLWHEIGNYVDDENGKPVYPVSMREEKRDTLLKMLKDSPDSYWWIDVLCARSDTPLDIMGDIYACCLECIAMVDCEPSLLPLLHTMIPAKEDFPAIRNILLAGLVDLSPYKQLYDKKYTHVVERLFDFMQSKWWQRVWTWQEMALPFGDVRLLAETGTHRHTIALDYLLDNYYPMANFMNYYVENRGDAEPSEPLRNVKDVHYWMGTVESARTFTKIHIANRSVYDLLSLFAALSDSARCCMNPVDYVYGVLGMLRIKIPRMKDPNAVWQTFLRELYSYNFGNFKVSNRARQVNLQEVEHMGDVYKDFFITSLDEPDFTTVLDKPDMEKRLHSPSMNDRVFDRCRIQ